MKYPTNKARKDHQCWFCTFRIPKGSVKTTLTITPWDHPDNEGWDTWHFHLGCWEVAAHLNWHVSDDDEGGWVDWREYWAERFGDPFTREAVRALIDSVPGLDPASLDAQRLAWSACDFSLDDDEQIGARCPTRRELMSSKGLPERLLPGQIWVHADGGVLAIQAGVPNGILEKVRLFVMAPEPKALPEIYQEDAMKLWRQGWMPRQDVLGPNYDPQRRAA